MESSVYSVMLSGVSVEFPFQPYQCQLVYMGKVIQALQEHSNAVLESPTGTGKTVCLLCAALGWRAELIRSLGLQQKPADSVKDGEGLCSWGIHPGSSGGVANNVPKIIYASRTHSQLSQVVRELKKTKYRPKVAIIGSREQLCIHPEVAKKDTNAEKVHLCRAKVKSHSCFYYNNTDVKKLRLAEAVMDIEDLVLVGSRQKMCPYYLARELKSDADVIFMPYNYLLDMKTRKMHGVDVTGAVVILDEAHNIERICEDSASFDLASGDIAQCIGDMDHILKLKMEEYSSEGGEDDDIQDFLNLKEFFLAVEKSLDDISLPDNNGKRELVKPGRFIFEFFATTGLTLATCPTFLDQCSKAISFLTTDSRSVHKNGNIVQKFMDAVKIVFNSPSASQTVPQDVSSSHLYKVFIKSEEAQRKSQRSETWTVSVSEAARRETRTLSYWCFSPGYAMAELARQGVWSVILTSGTLSPLQSFSSELCIDFPIHYEGPHVITQRQIWVGVVSKGCDGTALNSSYANRSSLSYQSSLGNTLVNFCRLVPHGMLVFFPSYPVMHSCVQSWRESGIMQRMEGIKPVLLEPRRKMEFLHTMEAFYKTVSDPAYNGAAFFAVCRGKVSEGLDFADVNGRAVVITGLPYPPRMDPKVKLKMQYLEETKHSSEHLGGEEWYKQQAYRAVNQAVGRVIRHLHDYGAIMLCDERFAYSNTKNQLPQWLRPNVRTYDKFGLVQRDLIQFFKNAQTEFGSKVPGASSISTECKSRSSSIHSSGVFGSHSYKGRSYKEALEHAKDANEVDLHIPSRKVTQVSLDMLKSYDVAESGPKDLLSCLVQCEGTTSSKKKIDLFTSLRLQQVTLASSPCTSETSFDLDEAQHQVPATTTTTTTTTTSSSSASSTHTKRKLVLSKGRKHQEGKMATVTGYVEEVQSSLSDIAFRRFTDAMFGYKKDKDIHKLCQVMKDIFKAPLFHLQGGMRKFILPEHRAHYTSFYQKCTGKSLPSCIDVGGRSTKREGVSFTCKELPKIKVQNKAKLSHYGESSLSVQKNPLSTELLSHSQHLDTREHLDTMQHLNKQL